MNSIVAMLTDKYKEIFSTDKELRAFFSPGRVNLIGEHTDYNGGHVFPSSITQGTYGIAKKREDREIHCYSMNFEEGGVIVFNLDDLSFVESDSWANFVKGMLKYLIEAGHSIDSGFNVLIYGNIPNGAGLSSSASLELLIGVIAENLFNLTLDRLDLIKIGQKTENQFMGVNSGIMDQFAIGMGSKDMAIFLNTNTLDYELVPAEFGDNVILIMNTNKRRELADSKYNQRRSECEEALRRLQTELAINSLGEMTEESFEVNRSLINDEVLERRAKHAVYENVRTLLAKDVLTKGKLKEFGELLNQSHISLRDDYEVTGLELDTLVEAAWQQAGVLGARMTGAGMGGCAIALVNSEKVEEVKAAVQAAYKEKIGYAADFYVAQIGDGAKELV
ncbi:galactokinase [Fundicoccus sp. Sow4_D5]|uniref:galactokinase n=1 Tax=Fundicoccus sp. Sow4_D5 TaxID=3438782 RepID=UPI003F919FEE